MNELALFAGAGGGILGGKLLGWRTVCAVEYEPYAAAILVKRQNDGILQPFPVWDDVRTFDGKPWRGRVDVVSGGFPCQDISVCGKGAGINGQQSGLWKEMARVICEVRPKFAFVENSPLLTQRGLSVVLGDLAEMGYDAQWGVLGAANVGLPIKRERIWILAVATGGGGEVCRYSAKKRNLGKHRQPQQQVNRFLEELEKEGKQCEVQARTDCVPPYLCELVDGMAVELDELKATGNGQVPAVAATAFCLLYERLKKRKCV